MYINNNATNNSNANINNNANNPLHNNSTSNTLSSILEKKSNGDDDIDYTPGTTIYYGSTIALQVTLYL